MIIFSIYFHLFIFDHNWIYWYQPLKCSIHQGQILIFFVVMLPDSLPDNPVKPSGKNYCNALELQVHAASHFV